MERGVLEKMHAAPPETAGNGSRWTSRGGGGKEGRLGQGEGEEDGKKRDEDGCKRKGDGGFRDTSRWPVSIVERSRDRPISRGGFLFAGCLHSVL